MTEKNYQPPEFEKKAFHCPHCGALAEQQWTGVSSDETITIWHPIHVLEPAMREYSYALSRKHSAHFAKCCSCDAESFWLDGEMLFPDFSGYPPPNDDMPDNVKGIYREAAAIANKSPRAAAALLRLALQKLCKELECPSDKLYGQISHLLENQEVPPIVVDAMEAIRLVGNDAVHPETVGIDVDKNPDAVSSLFEFVNFIVGEMISSPKRTRERIDKILPKYPDSKKIKPRKGKKP